MRAIRYSLVAIGVLALLALSAALVIRSLPGGPGKAPPAAVAAAPERIPQQESAAPAAVAPPAEQAAEIVSPVPPPPPPSSPTSFVAIPSEPPKAAGLAPLRLSPEQEERIRSVLTSHSIVQAETGDFPLRRGGIVPKEVPLTPLPYEVSGVVPDYRAYSYVIAGDQIVIVVTERRLIGAVIPL